MSINRWKWSIMLVVLVNLWFLSHYTTAHTADVVVRLGPLAHTSVVTVCIR